MPPDIADLKHDEWEGQNGPGDGKTSFFVEAYRTIEIVGPQIEIRADSLEEAIEIAELQVEVEGTALSRLQWNPKLRGCFVQEDTIKVRRIE